MGYVHAITISRPGGPEVLTWAEVPDPVPGPDEVLIDVVASAVNRADLMQREGHYDPPPGSSPYPGLECSGRISEVGSEVTGWRVGDEVCALLAGGGYAQKVAVHMDHLLPVPQNVETVDAAALPEVACTVWSNLFDLAGLQALDTVLLHGGGSGVGTFAIQLAAARGARVLATARAAKHEALRDLGAEVVIDYTAEDFVAAVRTATGGRGADIILDIVGGAYLARNVEALAVDGRLVVIGLQGGRKAELDLRALLSKRGSILATTLRARSIEDKARIVAGVREHVWPLIAGGLVRTVIHARLPMAKAAQAHELVGASEHIGKVLLVNDV